MVMLSLSPGSAFNLVSSECTWKKAANDGSGIESLLHIRESQVEFLAPDFDLAKPWMLQANKK